jgi:hypothetical protein
MSSSGFLTLLNSSQLGINLLMLINNYCTGTFLSPCTISGLLSNRKKVLGWMQLCWWWLRHLYCIELHKIIYSRVPIIQHSVLSDVPCWNAPFYQQSTQHVAEWITFSHHAPSYFMYSVATGLLLFRRWCDLARKNRKELRSKYPLLIS